MLPRSPIVCAVIETYLDVANPYIIPLFVRSQRKLPQAMMVLQQEAMIGIASRIWRPSRTGGR
jgi:hypothetical protein